MGLVLLFGGMVLGIIANALWRGQEDRSASDTKPVTGAWLTNHRRESGYRGWYPGGQQ